MAMFALDAPSQTPSAPSTTLQQVTAPATTTASGGGSNPSRGSNSNSSGGGSDNEPASNGDMNQLLQQSPFGRLSEVLGDDLSTIFEGLGAPGGNSSGNPFGNASGGGSSDLPYGGNPFAGDNFTTIFGGGNASSGNSSFGNSPSGNGSAPSGGGSSFGGGSPFGGGGSSFAGGGSGSSFGSGGSPFGSNASPGGSSSGGNSSTGGGSSFGGGGSPFGGGGSPFAGGSNGQSSGNSQSSGEVPFPYNVILEEAGVDPKDVQQELAQGGASNGGGKSSWSYDFGSNSPSAGGKPSGDSAAPGGGKNPVGGGGNAFDGGDASGIPTDANNVPFGGTSPQGSGKPKGSEPFAVGTNLTLETTIVADNKKEIEKLLNQLQVVGTNTTLKTTILTNDSGNKGQPSSDSSGPVIGSNISTSTGGGSPFGGGQASQGPPLPFNQMTQQSSTQNQQESFPFNLINQAAQELGKDGKGGSDNETFGNGNWYFGAENQTLGNGNWHFGSNNNVTGNGNWVFGDDNTVTGNGNWYLDGQPITKPGSGGQAPQAVPEPTSVLGILASSAFGVTSWLKRKRKQLVNRVSCQKSG